MTIYCRSRRQSDHDTFLLGGSAPTPDLCAHTHVKHMYSKRSEASVACAILAEMYAALCMPTAQLCDASGRAQITRLCMRM